MISLQALSGGGGRANRPSPPSSSSSSPSPTIFLSFMFGSIRPSSVMSEPSVRPFRLLIAVFLSSQLRWICSPLSSHPPVFTRLFSSVFLHLLCSSSSILISTFGLFFVLCDPFHFSFSLSPLPSFSFSISSWVNCFFFLSCLFCLFNVEVKEAHEHLQLLLETWPSSSSSLSSFLLHVLPTVKVCEMKVKIPSISIK